MHRVEPEEEQQRRAATRRRARRSGRRRRAPAPTASRAAKSSADIAISAFGYRANQTWMTLSASRGRAAAARCAPEQRAPRKYTATSAEDRPRAHGLSRPAQAVQAVADARSTPETGAGTARRPCPACGILDEEPHEPGAVVRRRVVRREEQVAGGGRHRRDHGIVTMASAPRWAIWIPFVHVGAGVLAAHHVLGRRQVRATATSTASPIGTSAPGPGRGAPRVQSQSRPIRQRDSDGMPAALTASSAAEAIGRGGRQQQRRSRPTTPC